MHNYLTVICEAGHELPEETRKQLVALYPKAFGYVVVEDDKISIDITSSEDYELLPTFETADKAFAGSRIIYSFYNTDATINKENIQPFTLAKDGDNVLVAGCITGALSSFSKADSSFSEEFFAVTEDLSEQIDDLVEKSDSFDELYAAFDKADDENKVMSSLVNDTGTVVLFDSESDAHICYRGENVKQYPWGWASGNIEALWKAKLEAEKPPSQAPTKKGGLRKTPKAGEPTDKTETVTTATPNPAKDKPLPDYSSITIKIDSPKGDKNSRQRWFDTRLGFRPPDYKNMDTYTITDPLIIQKWLASGGPIATFELKGAKPGTATSVPSVGASSIETESPVIKNTIRDDIINSREKGQIKYFLDQHTKKMEADPKSVADFEDKIPKFSEQLGPAITLEDMLKWNRTVWRFFVSNKDWNNAAAEAFLELCKQVRDLRAEIASRPTGDALASEGTPKPSETPKKGGLRKSTKAA